MQKTYTDTQTIITCDNCGAQGHSTQRGDGEAYWGSEQGVSEYTTISLERIESSYGETISHELLTIDLCPKCFLTKMALVGKLTQTELG